MRRLNGQYPVEDLNMPRTLFVQLAAAAVLKKRPSFLEVAGFLKGAVLVAI